MGWAEFRPVRNEYNESFKEIDNNLIRLLHDRKIMANGTRFFPPMELMEEWAKRYDMEIPQISWLMHSINEGPHSFTHDGPGELLNVIPIMKKSVVGEFEYVLTHSMQHENGSVVFLEIEKLDKDKNVGIVRSHLILEVNGKKEYQVNRHGSHGSDGRTKVEFLVIPRLPDQLDGISFSLMPYTMPMEMPLREVILDKDVSF